MSRSRKAGARRRGPTLAEVGRLAGVDASTVSQVLNEKENCWASAATRQRIFAAADKLGYRPNLMARSLASGRTHNLGLILTGLGSGSRGGRVDGFEAAASAAGFVSMISFNPNDPDVEDRLIQNHLDRGVDGLAIYPTDAGEHRELRRLVARGFPVVTFDGAARLDFACDDVSPDFEQAGRLQVEHLLALGRQRLALADAHPEARINTVRNAAIEARLHEAGAPAPRRMGLRQAAGRHASPAAELYPQVLDFVQRHGRDLDGIIGYDSLAALAVRALLVCGLRVPEDVAVLGSGNSDLGSFGILPLSTLDTDDEWLGRQAFELLQWRQEHPDAAPQQRTSVPRLVPRASTFAETLPGDILPRAGGAGAE